MRKIICYSILLVLASPLISLAQDEKVDLNMVQKIRKEGLENSKVMDIAFNLTDMSGNRLTNSPGYNRAANYAKETLKGWGLQNAVIDPWGEFGKGWELEKSYIAITAPYYKPLLAYPKAWTGGTKGLNSAEVIVITAKDSTDLENYRGKLKGKVIIMDQMVNYKQSFKSDAVRYNEEELNKMAVATMAPKISVDFDTALQRRQMQQFVQMRGGQRLPILLKEMAKSEGAIAMISSGGVRSHDGTIFAQGGGNYKATDPENFLDMAVGIEDFNTILRLAKAGAPIKLDVDVKTKFHTKDIQGYNVIAEIPGTDPALKDEVVMIGAHLDSWQTGTGATDNASGSSVMMEVMRILKTIGVEPKRTI